MIYKQLALMLTDTCTAACRFCGLGCSPKNSGHMELDFAKHVIDEVAATGTFDRIGLSGGEVFLYPELVREVLEYAKEAGLSRRTVATNGFWGAWSEEKLDEVIGGLKGCLTEVAFSHDAFHAEFIPSDAIWRAAAMLAKHEIQYSIHVADVKGEMGAGEFLASRDDNVFYKHYRLYPLASMGKAEDLPEEIFVREQAWNETWCYPDAILSVSWNGDVYPCCCPGVFGTEFKLGNLHDAPLSELLTKTRGMKYINAMVDPARFVRMLTFARDELGIDLPEKAVNGCELCYKVFSKPGAFDKLEPLLEKEYRELLMDRLLSGEVAQ